MKKTAAIAEVAKMRDQLVIIRERSFQLSAAIAARTREVEGLLIDCGAAGRVFGAPIGLPDWNKVLATPGRQSASSLDDELKIEMERVTQDIFWDSPESGLDRTNNDPLLLRHLVATLDEWVSNRPPPRRTLRRIVLERLEEVGPEGFEGRCDTRLRQSQSSVRFQHQGGWNGPQPPCQRRACASGRPSLVPRSAGTADGGRRLNCVLGASSRD